MARAADWSFESEPGLHVGEKITPISSAGLFVPSGKASYPSVAYQLGRAGHRRRRARSSRWSCRRCPTAAGGSTRPCSSSAASSGIDNVFRVNGPAGVAALGFGTESIPQVRKIVGPGSPPVACAQVEMQRYGVATMMILGPTESLVIADDSADPPLCRRRPVERGRARHRLGGAAGHAVGDAAPTPSTRELRGSWRRCRRHAPKRRAPRSVSTAAA